MTYHWYRIWTFYDLFGLSFNKDLPYYPKMEVQLTWEIPKHSSLLFKLKAFSVNEHNDPPGGVLDVFFWQSYQLWVLGFRLGAALYIGRHPE